MRGQKGKVVLVSKLQVVCNKKEFLRFGAFGARFKETMTVTVLPDDITIPTDVLPLLDSDAVDMDDVKRPRSTSASTVVVTQTAPWSAGAQTPSFVARRASHTSSKSASSVARRSTSEPWCRIRRGHRHSDIPPVEDSTVITTSSTSSPPVRSLMASIVPEEEDMVPVTY